MSTKATQEEVDRRLRGLNPATVKRITVRVCEELDAEYEALVEAGAYPTKSEAVRVVLRAFVGERSESDGE